MFDNQEEDSSPFDDKIALSLQRANDAAQKNKKRIKPKEFTAGVETTGEGEISKAFQSQVDKLFDEKQWRRLVKMPFLSLQAYTGRKEFALQDEEAEQLAVTTSMTVQFYSTVQPQTLALIMCSIAWVSILGGKTMEAMMARRKEIDDQRKQST